MGTNVIARFLAANRKKHLTIHCLGDAMVDEYFDVEVNRISPEFPMPIMSSVSSDPIRRPGGVANVAYQLRHFNVYSCLLSFYDEYASRVYCDCMLNHLPGTCFGRATLPIKRRYIDSGIQVVRHDIELPLCGLTADQIDEYHQGFDKELHRPQADLVSPLEKVDVAVLSDYDKGFFSGAKNYLDIYKGVKTIVDPKRGPLEKWKGCTIFKPNCKEAQALSGLSNWREQCLLFQEKLGCEAVVITHGGEKVVGIWRNEFFSYRPPKHVHVESVVGAGDCFCAIFAMAIGHEFTIPEAAEIAWNAGAIYVQNRMNRPITPAELSSDGIVEPEDLTHRDFKLVFTNGCFDLLHEGHLQLLEFAKSKGDRLVVAINSDDSVRRLKGPTRPIKPLEQRMMVMASLKPVDFVVYFDEDTPLEVIQKIKPDVLVKGQDWKAENIVGADIVPELFRAPIVEGLSTTSMLQRKK